MTEPRRVLFVSPQPVQHEGPAMRALAARPGIVMQVAYCSLPDRRLYQGDEYITKQAFGDAPAEGFPWIAVPNRSPAPSLGRFAGLFNPGLVSLIRRGRWDAVIIYGYAYASCWLAVLAARRAGAAVLLGSDATTLLPQAGGGWKIPVKRAVLPRIYGMADVVMVPSSAARRFVVSLGLPESRVVLTPYVVDNEGIAAAGQAADVPAIRAGWGIPAGAPVALFCGKFIPRKGALELVRAFARAAVPGSYLVLVGAGPLEPALRAAIAERGLEDRVRLPGLLPYRDLPGAYAAADVVVVPSSHEPWGLPVNEAMACGRPVVVSDRVGAGDDLVRPGTTGLVYPSGDETALATALRDLLGHPVRARTLGAAARRRLASWSPADNAAAVAGAVERAVIRCRGGAG